MLKSWEPSYRNSSDVKWMKWVNSQTHDQRQVGHTELNIHHPFHLVDARPWPLTGSIGRLCLVGGLASWIHKFDSDLMQIGLGLILLTIVLWWRDVTREATHLGAHTNKVEDGIRIGIVLFISSEVFFFLAFFWAFFHSSLRPNIEVGRAWPPTGIRAIRPFDVPLLNTTILLSRGATITWAHMAIMEDKWLEGFISLVTTVLLGIYFTALQAIEYAMSSFSMADRVYGRTFFIATGFHGLHVLIGTTFILVITIRHYRAHFTPDHHFGFEARAWYWHFVDVVWLFLFMCIYWWGFYFCKLSKLLSSYLKKGLTQKFLFWD